MNILCIGAHPDDVEIGMGGAILSFIADGHSVSILDLTDGEPTPMGSHEKRIKESIQSKEVLGLKTRVTLDLENRFLENTKEARKKVAAVIRQFRPDILFIPYWVDAHPDHIAASQLAEAARFTSKLTKIVIEGEPFYPKKVFHYFCLHLALTVKPSFILDITPYMDKKTETVLAYKSQFLEQQREEYIINKVLNNGRYWGSRIKKDYGEPFLCREEIGIKRIGEIIL